jgi:lysophospholipase L1-like esterase
MVKKYAGKVRCTGAMLFFLVVTILGHNVLAFDGSKIFFAGDSTGTCCFESVTGEDMYPSSLFNRLRAFPPPGMSIEPDRAIKSMRPCNPAQPDEGGYGGLKILDWATECVDSSGHGVCNWSCNMTDLECNCSFRRGCIEQSDAQYVILALLNNDLNNLDTLYHGDVKLVIEAAKSLIVSLARQGRTVIWLSYSPIRYGKLGNGRVPCSNTSSCFFTINSNAEYFYQELIPWIHNQQGVYIIDFFNHVKETYGSDVSQFSNLYQYDGVHLNPAGHQLYYDFVYAKLQEIVAGRKE